MNLDSLELVSERLIIRPLGTDYAEKVLTFFDENREFLEPWEVTRCKNFYTLRHMREYLHSEYMAIRNSESIRYWLFERSDKRLTRIIGSIGLNDIYWGNMMSATIGYRMHRDYAGQGYMTEALDSVRSFAFEVLGLHRLEVCIIPRNARSIRVVEKLGFVNEGFSPHYIKINGVWEDHYRFACLNEPGYEKLYDKEENILRR